MPWRLSDSRSRLDRAGEHINKFGKIWGAFLEDDPYVPSLTVDDAGEGILRVWPADEFPATELSLELGEALYQLRAALDSLVHSVAIIETGESPPPDEERLGFPICRTEAQWIGAAPQIKPLAKSRREVISAVQPCHTAKAPDWLREMSRSLEMLNDWARKDRHRALRIIGSWGSQRNPVLSLPDGVSLKWLNVTTDGFLEHDNVVAQFALDGWDPSMHPKMQGNPDLMIDVAVDEIPPPSDTDDTLSRRMREMYSAVSALVSEFEESLSRDPPSPQNTHGAPPGSDSP